MPTAFWADVAASGAAPFNADAKMRDGFPTAGGENGRSRNLMVSLWLSAVTRHVILWASKQLSRHCYASVSSNALKEDEVFVGHRTQKNDDIVMNERVRSSS